MIRVIELPESLFGEFMDREAVAGTREAIAGTREAIAGSREAIAGSLTQALRERDLERRVDELLVANNRLLEEKREVERRMEATQLSYETTIDLQRQELARLKLALGRPQQRRDVRDALEPEDTLQ